jgi:hypothetical protein
MRIKNNKMKKSTLIILLFVLQNLTGQQKQEEISIEGTLQQKISPLARASRS